MIGRIICAGELMMDALLELKDTLVIGIIKRGELVGMILAAISTPLWVHLVVAMEVLPPSPPVQTIKLEYHQPWSDGFDSCSLSILDRGEWFSIEQHQPRRISLWRYDADEMKAQL